MRASEYEVTGLRGWFCLGTGSGGRPCAGEEEAVGAGG